MTSGTGTYTADQLAAGQLAGKSDDGNRYELVNGELRMMSPAGAGHGRVAMRLGQLLANHVTDNNLGVVYAAETGFLISRNPDTVRAPDVAFVEVEWLRELADESGFLPLAPTLAAEVVSPNDSISQVEEKSRCWLAAGSKAVLVVDPTARTVQVYRPSADVCVLIEDSELDLSDVVPGWKFSIGDLFR